MKLLFQLSIASAVFGLAALAQDVMSFNQNTLGFSPVMGPFGKRATCSGTCASCYGTGNILCGTSSCYNPSAGESCCASFGYACSSGYFCPSTGVNSQCCKNGISADTCDAAVTGGLSTAAKIGLGIGIAILVIGIALCVGLCCCFRRRRARKAAAASTAAAPVGATGYPMQPTGAPQQAYGGQQAYQAPQQQYGAPAQQAYGVQTPAPTYGQPQGPAPTYVQQDYKSAAYTGNASELPSPAPNAAQPNHGQNPNY